MKEDWRQGFNFDAVKENWSHKVNWANVPFSHTKLFLYKALIEFLKGKNIILLLPKNQLVQKAMYEELLKEICDLHSLGEVAFVKDGQQMKNPYPRECVLIYLLQPTYIQKKSDSESK